jgi:acetyl esterase/lipase
MTFTLDAQVAAILSRDRKGPAVARQLLIYPMLDDRTTTPDPYIAPLAGWSYDDNATGWNALLGSGHEHREIDPSAAPGRLADAAGLPPAYIEVGQLDVFHQGVQFVLPVTRSDCQRRGLARQPGARRSRGALMAVLYQQSSVKPDLISHTVTHLSRNVLRPSYAPNLPGTGPVPPVCRIRCQMNMVPA